MRPLLLCALACAVSAQTPGGWITINGQPTNVTGREVAVLERGAQLCYSFPASVTFAAHGEQLCYGLRARGDAAFEPTCTSTVIQRQGCIDLMQGGMGLTGTNLEFVVRSGDFPSKQVLSASVNVLFISFVLGNVGASTAPAAIPVQYRITARRISPSTPPPPAFFVNMYDKDSRAILIAPLNIMVGTGAAAASGAYTFPVPRSSPTKGPYTMSVFVGSNPQPVLQAAPLQAPSSGWSRAGL